MEIVLIIIVFALLVFAAYRLGLKIGAYKQDKYWENELPNHRKDAVMRSRAILSGNFYEQLAPYFPYFSFNPNECKFIGKPIDFIVFKGMDNKRLDEIIFLEIKSGSSQLTETEKQIKEVVKNKKIRWEEYRVPENKNEKDF